MPYIVDGDQTVADSRLIIEYLKVQCDVDLNRGLTPTQKAQSLAFERMIEDDLFWVMLWSRWCQPHNWRVNKKAIFGCFGPVGRNVGSWLARRKVRADLWSQGISRLRDDEIFQIGNRDLDALSEFLGGKPYFMGEQPTTFDASACGLLINVISCPIESALKAYAESLGNLTSYRELMQDRYF